MKKIAILFEDNINLRLGVFNAVTGRAKHLAGELPHCHIDVFMVQFYDGPLMARVTGNHAPSRLPDRVDADGLPVNLLWCERSMLDSLGHRLFNRPHTRFLKWISEQSARFDDYDLISTHDRVAAQIGAEVARRRGVPHFVTWHGSSVHTDPACDKMLRDITVRLMQEATCNFFVSHGLEKMARDMAGDIRCRVLYNGASPAFYRYDEQERERLRRHYNVPGEDKVVAFVGSFKPVKNTLSLPAIFMAIEREMGGGVTFWTVGDGEHRAEVERAMKKRRVNCTFMGLLPPEQLPAILNCVDVLVLPSLLEGLPLVLLEAIQCGANAVSSAVVGCPEAVGRENAFEVHDPHFVENIAHRAVEMLQSKVTQEVPEAMSWTATAATEASIYRPYLTGDDRRPY